MADVIKTAAIDFTANDSRLVSTLQKIRGENQKTGDSFKALSRDAKDVFGTNLEQRATQISQAIQAIGGATKLTDAEAKTYLRTLDAWIAKSRALGKEVPDHVLSTRAALANVNTEAGKTPGVLSKIGGAATSMAGALGIAFGAGAVVSFATSVLAAAGNIDDTSKALGVSAEAVQRWKFAAEQGGATIDDVGRAVNLMNRNLAEGDKSTVGALRDAGLQFEDIRRMKPEDAFNAIVKAIQDIPDPMERARVAQELFGRGAAEILPAIVDGFADVAKGASVMSNETVKRLADAEDAWQRLWDKVVIVTGGIIGDVLAYQEKSTSSWQNFFKSIAAATPGGASFAIDLAKQIEADRKAKADAAKNKPAAPGAQAPPPTVMVDYVAQLKKAREEVASLTQTQRDGIAAAREMGASTEEITKQYKISEGALRLLNTQTRTGTKIVNERQQALKDLAAAAIPLTKQQKEFVDQNVKLGASHSLIARALGVSELAVKNYADQQKRLNDIIKEQIALLPMTRPNLANLNLGAGLTPQLPFVPRTSLMGPLIDTLNREFGRIDASNLGAKAAIKRVKAGMQDEIDANPRSNWKKFLQPAADTSMLLRTAHDFAQTTISALGDAIATGDWDTFKDRLSEAASSAISAGIASALDLAVPGLGQLMQPFIKGLVDRFINLFRDEEAAHVNDLRDAFLLQFGPGGLQQNSGFHNLARQLNALGRGDLFDRVRTARTEEAFQAAVEAITEALEGARNEMQRLAQEGGLASQRLLNFIDATRDSAESVAFLKSETRSAITAIGDFAKSSQFTTQGGATAATELVAAAVAKMRDEGLSMRQILQEIGPTILEIQKQLAESGFSGSAAFAQIAADAEVASGEITGPLLDGVAALTRGLEAASNARFLTPEMFQGLTAEIVAGRQALLDQGVAAEQVDRLMQHSLQTIWQLQQDFGFAVDETTQALLDQAEAEGRVGDQFRSTFDRIAVATERIADGIDRLTGNVGKLGDEAERTGRRIDGAFRSRTVDIGFRVAEPPDVGGDLVDTAATGGVVGRRGIVPSTRYYRLGDVVRSIFQPRGTDTVPAMLTPGEGILNTRAMDLIGANALHALNAGRLPAPSAAAPPASAPTITYGDIHVTVQGNVDSDDRVKQIGQEVAKRLRRGDPDLLRQWQMAMPALSRT